MGSVAAAGEAQRQRVGVVGAGRMGRALVVRLSDDHDMVVVSRRTGSMSLPGGREIAVGDDPAALRECALVLLAVPAHEVAAALARVAPHLQPSAIAVNLATELPTSELDTDGVRVIGCKIVGQSARIEGGAPAALIVDGATDDERALLLSVLSPLGVVLNGPESLVATVNDLVARRMITAQFELAAALEQAGLPPEARDVAIGTLAVGVWESLARGNTGPFLTKIVNEMLADSHR